MSGSKVGLCTVNDSSEVTMINEDGVIAEMIIEVDDDSHLETHEPFNFELDEDDDCIEVFSSGFAPSRNNYIGHDSSENWICNKDAQCDVNGAGVGKEVTPGLRDLSLHTESAAEKPSPPIAPVTNLEKSATDLEKAQDSIVIDNTSAKKPKRKPDKKLPPPRSGMVTRGKAAANQIAVSVSKDETKDKAAKKGTVDPALETKCTSKDSVDVDKEVTNKDITDLVSEGIPSKVTSEQDGDTDTVLIGGSKGTNDKSLMDQVSGDICEKSSETPKETTESTTLDPESTLESSAVQSGEKVVPISSSTPDTAESSSELHENSLASEVNEANFANHNVDEDQPVAEQQTLSGSGEKLGDIPYIQQAIKNATKKLGLRSLYKLICGFRVPKDMEMIKEQVWKFNGFPFEENSIGYERKVKTLKTFPDVARKQICCILGIEVSSETDVNYEILKFLLKPKCRNSQFLSAHYQPMVWLERLPAELLKYENVESDLVQMVTPVKKKIPERRCKKRKAAVAAETSEVRLTRSAKRLMKCKEEEKAEEVKKTIVPPSRDASEEKRRKFKEDENKSQESKVPVKSRKAEKVKAKKDVPDASVQESSDSETDEGIENVDHPWPDSSEGESGSFKGTLGRNLGDFPKIRQNVEKADKESLQTLHTILYDNYSNYDKPENWKKNILRFSGFNFKCVSSKWRRKEFILSLMPPNKLKRIADVLHLQYYSSKSQKPLVLNIMKFLSEPRDGMLKRDGKLNFLQKRRKRRKMFSATTKQQDHQILLDDENTVLEVEALLQDIRKKRHSDHLEDSSADSDLPGQNSFRKSKKKKLGDIPNVQFMIITSNYEDIDNLHQLLFLQSGPRAKIRRNVQNFEGFAFGPGSFSYKIRIKLLNKMGYEIAKRIAFFLGLTSLGTTLPQQDLNELIMHFLMCPGDIKSPSKSPSFPPFLAKELPIFHSAVSAGKAIKVYPKNFFNNNPTERPVVDITSITDAMKSTMKVEKQLAKERELHKENPEETKTECETSGVEFVISEDGAKKIKREKDVPQNDSSELHVAENVMGSDVSTGVKYEESRGKSVDSDQNIETLQNQKNSEMSLPVPRAVRKRSIKTKQNVPAVGRKKRTVSKKENSQPDKDVKPELDDMPKKQFLFRFDPNNKFDSKKILEYLNKESQKSVSKEGELPKTEVTKPVQTIISNVPLKITSKPELQGSPKVISILLPPPSQSPQKNISVTSDFTIKTNSSASNVGCVMSLQNMSTSSSNVPSLPEGKLPIPPLPKKQVISVTPQSLQSLQPRMPSTNVTQIKVPSSLLESMKGSQIEGVIRLPQNFAVGQNSGQASSSGGVANDVLSLPEVQKCLQQINSANGKKKQVQMIKIPANNSVAFQPGSLNMSGGKVFVIPVKPGSRQFSSLPASSVVTPIQLNSNHIVVPSSTESGTPVSIPQLIQVAKNYSRTVGTTAVPVSNVTITKVKPDFVGPISLPTVSASQSFFPVNVAPNSNIVHLPVVNIQNTLGKESSSLSEPPFLVKTDKVDAEMAKQNQNLKQKEDNNSDSELDEEPLSHLVGHPSDDMLIKNIREIVVGADLSSITMRKVLQQVFDKYPQFDLTYRKSFLKDAVKKVICSAPPSKIS